VAAALTTKSAAHGPPPSVQVVGKRESVQHWSEAVPNVQPPRAVQARASLAGERTERLVRLERSDEGRAGSAKGHGGVVIERGAGTERRAVRAKIGPGPALVVRQADRGAVRPDQFHDQVRIKRMSEIHRDRHLAEHAALTRDIDD
jgi:hypothetical protein